MVNSCYAAIDIGTSRLKLGVFADGMNALQVLQNVAVPVELGDESACMDWSVLQVLMSDALHVLAQYCQDQGVDDLHIGMCGQVSSLMPWQIEANKAELHTIPIWLDRRCAPSMDAVAGILGDETFDCLSSYLPMATNWLAVKLHHYLQDHNAAGKKFLQLHDAVFYQLTGVFSTHPSSQVSVLDQARMCYADKMLKGLGLGAEHFPAIKAGHATPIQTAQQVAYDLPRATFVYPGLADMYAGFNGFFLESGELFWQCNTSEIFGYYGTATAQSVLMRQPLDEEWIYYGSTNSGGHNINWFMEHVAGDLSLEELSAAAADIPIGSDGLIYLPFLSGERAPHWNPQLSASFEGLQSRHSKAHMFRAVLEGVAFNKRDILSYLPDTPTSCKLSGGSSVNQLWNTIRANVINTALHCIAEKEVAMLGVLRHVAEQRNDVLVLRQLHDRILGKTIQPNPPAVTAYNDVYNDYQCCVQSMLQRTKSKKQSSAKGVIHA